MNIDLSHPASCVIASGIASTSMLLLFSVTVSAQETEQTNRTRILVEQALRLMPHTEEGERTYAKLCASCHGPLARGVVDSVTPALAGQWPSYLVRELVDMAEANRSAPEMHRLVARKELASAQALSNVAHYLYALPRETNPQTGDGAHVLLGKRIFEAECLQCHGARANGDARAGVPALQGQHYAYLLLQSRQMPVTHGSDIGVETLERFEDLKLDELEAVCDYISRLRVDSSPDQVVGINDN